MKPHSLSTITLEWPQPQPQPMERRFGTYAKGAVLPETMVPHSPRRKVMDFPDGFIPARYFEPMEHNQLTRHCCKQRENLEIESLKSHPEEPALDIYIFHCVDCGNKHRRLCVGLDDTRPEWR